MAFGIPGVISRMFSRRGGREASFYEGPQVFYPRELRDAQTISDIIRKVPVVSASMRHYLDLGGRAKWDVRPAETGDGSPRAAEEMAARVKANLFEDLDWPEFVRRALTYKLYGYALLEWTAAQAEDGSYRFSKISPVAQSTVTSWRTDENGDLVSFTQNHRTEIPREKAVYVGATAINDTMEGFGYLKAVEKTARDLVELDDFERTGFLNAVAGLTKIFAPRAELLKQRDMAADDEERKAIQAQLNALDEVANAPGRNLGGKSLKLDSEPWSAQDEAGRPSTTRKWDVEVLRGGAEGVSELQEAKRTRKRDIMTVFGTEFMDLGDQSGSRALAEAKYGQFGLMVEDSLQAVKRAAQSDLVERLFGLNPTWDRDLIPDLTVQSAALLSPLEKIEAFERIKAIEAQDAEDPALPDLRSELGVAATADVDRGEARTEVREEDGG